MKIGGSPAFSYTRKLSSNQLISSLTKGEAPPKVGAIHGGEDLSPIQGIDFSPQAQTQKTPQSRSISDLTSVQVFERPLDLFLRKNNETQQSEQTSTNPPESNLSENQSIQESSSQESNEQGPSSNQNSELSKEEEKQIQELKSRDAEVVQHENAHKAAAGPYASGGPVYDYQSGPDGQRYRVGGHVNVDTSKEATPEATIQKAQVLQRAANAPAEPSGQDRSVASSAAKMEAEARKEISQKDNSSDSDTDSQDTKVQSSTVDSKNSEANSNKKLEKPSQLFNRAIKAYANTSSIASNTTLQNLNSGLRLSA
ncbi:MAG: hypothetical protein COB02_14455 [Candidatus Cloacimonadota bacterium]|nr:MAG: hypothetical protein COB02_14455 [Candidatus Cloacimonadota bacterium]